MIMGIYGTTRVEKNHDFFIFKSDLIFIYLIFLKSGI